MRARVPEKPICIHSLSTCTFPVLVIIYLKHDLYSCINTLLHTTNIITVDLVVNLSLLGRIVKTDKIYQQLEKVDAAIQKRTLRTARRSGDGVACSQTSPLGVIETVPGTFSRTFLLLFGHFAELAGRTLSLRCTPVTLSHTLTRRVQATRGG